jgi:hypothetical protein
LRFATSNEEPALSGGFRYKIFPVNDPAKEPPQSEPDEAEPRYPNSFVVAVSREQWERDFDQNVEIGLAKPGETYSDYIRSLHRIFGFVCMGHHRH